MSRLQERIREGKFVFTAEIVPPLAASPEALLAEAESLGTGVDAINVTDAAAGRTTMSSFAAAALLVSHGYEAILQVTCRDRNRIALAGDLIGAAAQGVENLLLLRGDDPKGGDQPDATPVFDLDTTELIKLARDMRDKGMLPSGRAIISPPKFFIGGADIPRLLDENWSPEPLRRKIENGAGFLQTQFCFDLEVARRYFERLGEEGITEQAAIIVGVGPIRSAKSARWMNTNLVGAHVPEDQAAEGRAICVELIEGLRDLPGPAGAHLMAPAQGAQAIAAVLAELGATG